MHIQIILFTSLGKLYFNADDAVDDAITFPIVCSYLCHLDIPWEGPLQSWKHWICTNETRGSLQRIFKYTPSVRNELSVKDRWACERMKTTVTDIITGIQASPVLAIQHLHTMHLVQVYRSSELFMRETVSQFPRSFLGLPTSLSSSLNYSFIFSCSTFASRVVGISCK
jgi:hypothetical protein